MPSLGLPELLVIFLILLLIFGINKIPLLGKGLGEGIRNFKKGLKSDETASESENSEPSPKSPS